MRTVQISICLLLLVPGVAGCAVDTGESTATAGGDAGAPDGGWPGANNSGGDTAGGENNDPLPDTDTPDSSGDAALGDCPSGCATTAPCLVGSCVDGECVFDPVAEGTSCGGDDCDPATCVSGACTIDENNIFNTEGYSCVTFDGFPGICSTGVCNQEGDCFEDSQCGDSDGCYYEFCDAGFCNSTIAPAGDPCTRGEEGEGVCNESGECGLDGGFCETPEGCPTISCHVGSCQDGTCVYTENNDLGCQVPGRGEGTCVGGVCRPLM